MYLEDGGLGGCGAVSQGLLGLVVACGEFDYFW